MTAPTPIQKPSEHGICKFCRADRSGPTAEAHDVNCPVIWTSLYEKDERPFFWVAPYRTGCAPSGWYQWTESGLKYLGESILEPVEEAEEVK